MKKKTQQKTDNSVKTLKAAIKMHLITTMWMFAWALQFSTPEKSGHIMFIDIVAYFKQ